MKENYSIANQFNNSFVDSIKLIRNSIELVQYVNQTDVINTKFKFCATNLIELKDICKSMKNKLDFNNIFINIILDN